MGYASKGGGDVGVQIQTGDGEPARLDGGGQRRGQTRSVVKEEAVPPRLQDWEYETLEK